MVARSTRSPACGRGTGTPDRGPRSERNFIAASNSALANALGGPNPTLTSQALATRTAEKIVQKYFDGEPWVGSEVPTSSIDDAVTQAVLDRGL